jgi:hypothetical protein
MALRAAERQTDTSVPLYLLRDPSKPGRFTYTFSVAIGSFPGSLRSYAHQKYILVFRLVESLGDPGEPVSQVVVENPVNNSPFDEPTRHFRFNDESRRGGNPCIQPL